MGKEGGCLPPLDLFLWCCGGLELKVLPGPLGEKAIRHRVGFNSIECLEFEIKEPAEADPFI